MNEKETVSRSDWLLIVFCHRTPLEELPRTRTSTSSSWSLDIAALDQDQHPSIHNLTSIHTLNGKKRS